MLEKQLPALPTCDDNYRTRPQRMTVIVPTPT